MAALLQFGDQQPSSVSASNALRWQCNHQLALHGPSAAKLRSCAEMLQHTVEPCDVHSEQRREP